MKLEQVVQVRLELTLPCGNIVLNDAGLPFPHWTEMATLPGVEPGRPP